MTLISLARVIVCVTADKKIVIFELIITGVLFLIHSNRLLAIAQVTINTKFNSHLHYGKIDEKCATKNRNWCAHLIYCNNLQKNIRENIIATM